jgi:imidazolonepropionase
MSLCIYIYGDLRRTFVVVTGNAGELKLWRNARLATMAAGQTGLGVVENASILVQDGRIAAIGPDLSSAGAEVIDVAGRWILPGLIDCHTHLVFGGHRAQEFEMRLDGASYEAIARAGGGIVSTVSATNALTIDGLVSQALPRLDQLLREGVTTFEIKSGYGLSIQGELNMLRAARHLAKLRPVRIMTSYLAAHAVPAAYKGRNADYIADVVLPGMEQGHAEGLIDAVDGFCEGIAFSVSEMRLVFEKAQSLGLPIKLHAEQLSNLRGAALAASFGALSADHLEYLDAEGAAAMARSGTVAVLLPGAFYAIREIQKPPIQMLRDAGVPIAVSTDCNPGSSPLTSLLLAMNMAATFFGLTVTECLSGVTRNAARALGVQADTGTLEVGKAADFSIWDIDRPAELVYRIGFNPLHSRVHNGKVSDI